jgi:phage-related protein
MAATLPSTIKPNYELHKSSKARVMKTGFGDGYSQRTADGINVIDLEYDLEYIGTTAEIDELDTHFTERAGYQAFTVVSGGWVASTSYKWVCEEWSVSDLGNGVKSLSAKITRVFDL